MQSIIDVLRMENEQKFLESILQKVKECTLSEDLEQENDKTLKEKKDSLQRLL